VICFILLYQAINLIKAKDPASFYTFTGNHSCNINFTRVDEYSKYYIPSESQFDDHLPELYDIPITIMNKSLLFQKALIATYLPQSKPIQEVSLGS